MTDFEIGSISPKNVNMYDSTGAIVHCKCGKEAGSAVIGKAAFVAWCSDCSPMSKYEAKLIYRDPIHED